MRIPQARGVASGAVFDLLTGGLTDAVDRAGAAVTDAVNRTTDILNDDDLQLALFVLYELHYRGIDGVDEELGVGPGAARRARALERRLRGALRGAVPVPEPPEPTARAVADALFALTAADDGPSLSRYIAKARDRRAGARVPRSSVDLPAQGGRPAQLGDPAAGGRGQGGAGRDPGGRVRRRAPGARCTPTIFARGDARARARRRLRRLRRPGPGDHARLAST